MMTRDEARKHAYEIAREALRKALETDMLWEISQDGRDIRLLREECDYLMEFVLVP